MNKQDFKNYFWNMKAMKYYDPDLQKSKAQDMIKNKDENYIAMQKWDGEWNMAIILEDEVIMRGRNKTVSGDYKDRAESLPHITEQLKDAFPPGTVVLGELAFKDLTKTSRDVSRIMRCLPPKAIKRQKDNPLSFFVFDCLAFSYKNLIEEPFNTRIHYAWNLCDWDIDKYPEYHTKYIIGPEIIADSFMDFAEEIWAKGGEGLVIIKKDEPYRPGKRKAWTSLKLKRKLGKITVDVIDTLNPTRVYKGKELEDWKYFEIEKRILLGDIEVWDHVDFRTSDTKIKEPFYRTTPVTKAYFNGWKAAIKVKYKNNIISVASGLTDNDKEWLSTEKAQRKIEDGLLKAKITGMAETKDSIRHPVFLKFIVEGE